MRGDDFLITVQNLEEQLDLKWQAHLQYHMALALIAKDQPEEAAELLTDPARRVHDAGEAELAKRIIGEDDAALRFAVPRPESPPPWRERV